MNPYLKWFLIGACLMASGAAMHANAAPEQVKITLASVAFIAEGKLVADTHVFPGELDAEHCQAAVDEILAEWPGLPAISQGCIAVPANLPSHPPVDEPDSQPAEPLAPKRGA